MKKKYEFTGETKNHEGKILHRIRRISDGELGGWIEKEENLSQEGDCWVGDEAMVFDSAQVSGSAWVFDSAWVYDSARVFDSAQVSGYTQVYGSAMIYGSAWVFSSAHVYNSARVYGYANVFGSAWVSGFAIVTRNPIVVTNALPWTVTITDKHVQVGCKQFEINDTLWGEIRLEGATQSIDNTVVEYCISILEPLIKGRALGMPFKRNKTPLV